MKKFNINKWRNKHLLKEQTTYGDIAQSFDKNVASFTQDLEKYLNEPKVKAVLDAGLADGDPNDDKISYTTRSVAVKNLQPTQNIIGFDESVQANITNEYGSLQSIFDGTPNVGGPIVTYAGKYIIDGHHRWSSVFSVNPGANMDAIDIKAKQGFQPDDILKAVHTSVALDIDYVKRSTADPAENLYTKMNYNGVLGKVNKYLTDQAKVIWAENGYSDNESIANALFGNLQILKDRGFINNAPDRSNMPQVDAAGRGTEIDRIKDLSTGRINISAPFKPINENKKMKNILKERFQKLAGLKEEEDERFNQDIKTVTGLANQFLSISKRLRNAKYKDVQAGEINEIDDLITLILQAAEEGNVTAILQRVKAIVSKQIKEPKLGDEPVSSKFSEPMGDIGDEII